jgi:1-deoxy-D-xylulose-5-phosphate reductoisomerase
VINRLAVIGSTGSIGRSTLAVADAHSDRLRVVALAAGENTSRFADQIARYSPALVAMASETGLQALDRELRARDISRLPRAMSGAAGLIAVATHPEADTVLFASSGTASLEAVLAAIEAGKRIALANKEILVMAGRLVMEAARRRGVDVLPVDSEHNAIHQCLHGRRLEDVRRLVLTASGGPFRGLSAADLSGVTAADALRHPTWNMGPKITIDSATLMNKGLEVIEARWLFDAGPERISVLVHPQSIVHSMVEFVDGSIVAQLGVTDMRLPIQYALSFPERWTAAVPPLDLAAAGPLTFEQPDTRRFPSLDLAFRALSGDAGLPIVLNAANEVAVDAFLQGNLQFPAIPAVIAAVMDWYEREDARDIRTVADVRAVDAAARRIAARHTTELRSKVL